MLAIRTDIHSPRPTLKSPVVARSRYRASSKSRPNFNSSTRCKSGAVCGLWKLFGEYELGGILIANRVAIRTGYSAGDVAGMISPPIQGETVVEDENSAPGSCRCGNMRRMAVGPTSIWAAIANIWFVVWAIRRQGELDYELDETMKLIRWVVASLCLGFTIFRPEVLRSPRLRISVGLIGLAFLVWPNLACHLTNLLRFLKLLPRPNPKNTI
jgi:hypothetical protein